MSNGLLVYADVRKWFYWWRRQKKSSVHIIHRHFWYVSRLARFESPDLAYISTNFRDSGCLRNICLGYGSCRIRLTYNCWMFAMAHILVFSHFSFNIFVARCGGVTDGRHFTLTNSTILMCCEIVSECDPLEDYDLGPWWSYGNYSHKCLQKFKWPRHNRKLNFLTPTQNYT